MLRYLRSDYSPETKEDQDSPIQFQSPRALKKSDKAKPKEKSKPKKAQPDESKRAPAKPLPLSLPVILADSESSESDSDSTPDLSPVASQSFGGVFIKAREEINPDVTRHDELFAKATEMTLPSNTFVPQAPIPMECEATFTSTFQFIFQRLEASPTRIQASAIPPVAEASPKIEVNAAAEEKDKPLVKQASAYEILLMSPEEKQENCADEILGNSEDKMESILERYYGIRIGSQRY